MQEKLKKTKFKTKWKIKKHEQNENFRLCMEKTMSVLVLVYKIQNTKYKIQIQNTKYNYGDDVR